MSTVTPRRSARLAARTPIQESQKLSPEILNSSTGTATGTANSTATKTISEDATRYTISPGRIRKRDRFKQAFSFVYNSHWSIRYIYHFSWVIAALSTTWWTMTLFPNISVGAVTFWIAWAWFFAEVSMVIFSILFALNLCKFRGSGQQSDLVINHPLELIKGGPVWSKNQGTGKKISACERIGQYRPPQVVRWDIAGVLASRLFGVFASIPLPRCIRPTVYRMYANMTKANLDEVEQPLPEFRNLGEFFTRSLKPGLRPIDPTTSLCSPVDGKIVVMGAVHGDQIEQVKGVTYSMSQFLGEHSADTLGPNTRPRRRFEVSEEAVERRSGGKNQLFYCVAYLAPGDYHQLHSPADFKLERLRHFPGTLFPISPLVTRMIPNLFALNERVVMCGEWKHGAFSYSAVGAYNVGSICVNFEPGVRTNQNIHRNPNIELMSYGGVGSYAHVIRYDDETEKKRIQLSKGENVGCFNFGSTIVLIFEAPKDFKFSVKPGDTVRLGQALGQV